MHVLTYSQVGLQADRKVLETKLANALKWRDLAERRLEEMGDLENKMANIHNAWAPTGFSDPNVSLSLCPILSFFGSMSPLPSFHFIPSLPPLLDWNDCIDVL